MASLCFATEEALITTALQKNGEAVPYVINYKNLSPNYVIILFPGGTGKKYKNRHLIVHHKNDGCHSTPFGSAEASHKKYGTDFIVMQGGTGQGDPCGSLGHHGFNGIQKETIEAIKKWIKQK